MTQLSSYRQYLPPVLWSGEHDPDQFLGQVLCIFEKILTGIPDRIPLTHGRRGEYLPFEQIIDELPRLFDPWRTPTAFLSELAAWLGLALPDWSEYQQRALIAAIASIYQRRGTKQALLEYLDIYGARYGRPRITIDDGEALFRARFRDDGLAQLTTITYSHPVTRVKTTRSEEEPSLIVKTTTALVLVRPVALAVAQDNTIIVIDQDGGLYITTTTTDKDGQKTTEQTKTAPAIWRLTTSGEATYSGDPPLPQPLHCGKPLLEPTAIVVNDPDMYVTDLGNGSTTRIADASLYRFTLDDALETVVSQETVLSQETHPGWAVRPIGMVRDSNGNLIILDRGTHPTIGDPPSQHGDGAAKAQIVVVNVGSKSFSTHRLSDIVEPTAMVIDSQGRLIVADAGSQTSTTPARLFRIDPINWKSTPLLKDVPSASNPLIFPTGLALETDTSLFVCDTGVRWGWNTSKWNRILAEPAVIYRLDLAPSPPTITTVTKDRRMVMPTKIVLDSQGRLLIADQGERRTEEPQRNWRASSHEFGIVVLFSQQRSTTPPDRDRMRREIVEVIEPYKPAKSIGWIDY
jgi:phage tail-like protein